MGTLRAFENPYYLFWRYRQIDPPHHFEDQPINLRSLKEAEVFKTKEDRKTEAKQRAEVRADRTNEEQLEVLRQRGVTEGREVDRLKARIA